jgi:hypothetical protein
MGLTLTATWASQRVETIADFHCSFNALFGTTITYKAFYNQVAKPLFTDFARTMLVLGHIFYSCLSFELHVRTQIVRKRWVPLEHAPPRAPQTPRTTAPTPRHHPTEPGLYPRHRPNLHHLPWQATGGPVGPRLMNMTPSGLSQGNRTTLAKPLSLSHFMV